jgi:hypothetical protein
VAYTEQAEKVRPPLVSDQHPPWFSAHLPGPTAEATAEMDKHEHTATSISLCRHGMAWKLYLCSGCTRRPRTGRRSPRGTRTPCPCTCPAHHQGGTRSDIQIIHCWRVDDAYLYSSFTYPAGGHVGCVVSPAPAVPVQALVRLDVCSSSSQELVTNSDRATIDHYRKRNLTLQSLLLPSLRQT